MVFSHVSGISLMVERQFSKLRAGVRFSYPALDRVAVSRHFQSRTKVPEKPTYPAPVGYTEYMNTEAMPNGSGKQEFLQKSLQAFAETLNPAIKVEVFGDVYGETGMRNMNIHKNSPLAARVVFTY